MAGTNLKIWIAGEARRLGFDACGFATARLPGDRYGPDDLRSLADRIFRSGPPTLASVGPTNGMMDRDAIAARLGIRGG